MKIELEIDMKKYFNKFIETATKEKVYYTPEERDKLWAEQRAELKGAAVSACFYVPEYKLITRRWFKKFKWLLWR